jgi:hypothetical protein
MTTPEEAPTVSTHPNPTTGSIVVTSQPGVVTVASTKRSAETLLDLLRERAARCPLPAVLGPVLFATYTSRHELKEACHRWSKGHAKECGTGYFKVKLDGWGHAGKKRGKRGYVKCCVPGCCWHLRLEEADAGVDSEGEPRVQVCVYDYNIAHTPGGHVGVDATRVELANTPGWTCIPEALHGLTRLCSRAGRSAHETMQMLDAAAAERGMQKSWNYQVVWRYLQSLNPPKALDAQGVLIWLQERQEKDGWRFDVFCEPSGAIERIFFQVGGSLEWRLRGFHLVLYDTTHGTNSYNMKLGCFTGINGEGKTILLGVSLLKFEDGASFAWAFRRFAESMELGEDGEDDEDESWHPDVIFTDSDVKMAAAAATVWPNAQHLLCSYHISQNLKVHAAQLFPHKKDAKQKKEFEDTFHGFLNKNSTSVHAANFAEDWYAMLEQIHSVTPCPWGLPDDFADAREYMETDDEDDTAECMTAIAIALEDEDRAKALEAARAEKAGKHSAASLGWRWLQGMYRKRRQWARCYIKSHFTADTFSTQRAESWHSALKQYMSATKRLLDLCQQIEAKREDMTEDHDINATRDRKRTAKAGGEHRFLAQIRSRVTNKAHAHLKASLVLSSALDVDRWEPPGGDDENEPVYLVYDAAEPGEKARCSVPGSCTCQTPRNRGLPCEHQLAVLEQQADTRCIPDDTIHSLWKIPSGEERAVIAEQLDARKKLGQKEMGKKKKKRSGAAVEDAVAKVSKADIRAAVFSATRNLATILESYPSELVDALEALTQITRQVEANILSDRSKPTKKKKRAPPAPPAMTTGATPDVGESAPAVEDDAKVTMETFGDLPDEVQVRNPSCAPAPGRMPRARKKKSWEK